MTLEDLRIAIVILAALAAFLGAWTAHLSARIDELEKRMNR